MFRHKDTAICLLLSFVISAPSEAFFLKWGSDSGSQTSSRTWAQPVSSYRYQYMYPYESRKLYQLPQQYQQPEMLQENIAPIPISVPVGASLTPVSLQHVQLVPCMCPVAPEEAEKMQEQVGPAPYVPQSYQQTYSVPQQLPVADAPKTTSQQ